MYSISSENKSFIKATPSKVQASSTVRTFNIRETPSGATFKITASSDANEFMNSPPNPTKIPGPIKARSTPRVHRIFERKWSKSSLRKEESVSSNSTGKNIKEVIILEATPNEEVQTVEAETLATNETEEHEA